MIIPPYNGFGSIDDTVQNCLSLVPQPPKKDFIKMLENDNKTLRYAASMVPIRPEDKNRRFILTYRLADHMITIFEPPLKLSGFESRPTVELRLRVKCDWESENRFSIKICP